jgi:hypothetical protein
MTVPFLPESFVRAQPVDLSLSNHHQQQQQHQQHSTSSAQVF